MFSTLGLGARNASARSSKFIMCTLCGVLLYGTAGCVSQADYDKLKFAERQANADRGRLRDELEAERTKNAALAARLAEIEKLLKIRDDLIASLQGENNQLRDQVKKLNDAMGKMSTVSADPVIIERPALPAPLNEALIKFAKDHPGMVEYDPKTGLVRFKSDLTFAPGSDEVKDEAKTALKEFAAIINGPDAQTFDVLIIGNTDTVPVTTAKTKARFPNNWYLSCGRAISVLDVFLGAAVAPTRIGVMGFGEFRPIADNPAKGGNEKNRRVDIYLVPKGQVAPGATGPAAMLFQVKPITQRIAELGMPS